MRNLIPTAELAQHIGCEIAVSDWLAVDREHLQMFARATYLTPDDVDLTFSRNNRYGPDLIDGFLLLALLTHFHFQVQPYGREPGTWGLNYGLDRVRFLSPVMVGQRLRCRVQLLDVREKRAGQILVKTLDTLELENSEKPAMVADWWGLIMLENS